MVRRNAEYLLDQWKSVKGMQNLQNGNNVGEYEDKWSKPHNGWLKCNIDAAVFTQEGYSGFG